MLDIVFVTETFQTICIESDAIPPIDLEQSALLYIFKYRVITQILDYPIDTTRHKKTQHDTTQHKKTQK